MLRSLSGLIFWYHLAFDRAWTGAVLSPPLVVSVSVRSMGLSSVSSLTTFVEAARFGDSFSACTSFPPTESGELECGELRLVMTCPCFLSAGEVDMIN